MKTIPQLLLRAFPLLALLLLVAASALMLASCEGPPLPRQVAYDEAAFAATDRAGSGSVVGQGFATMENGLVRYLSNTTIDLTSVNAYTVEIIQRRFEEGRKLQPPDPRLSRHVRTVDTDESGHFAFHGLPPGDYYLGSSIDWKNWNWNTDADGTWYKVWIQYVQPIYAQVHVRSGETVRVTQWSYGRERSS